MAEEIELMISGKSHQVGNPGCGACREGFPKRHECGGLLHGAACREGSKVRSTECDQCHQIDMILEVGDQAQQPEPRLDDDGSVFCGKNIGYCFEKIHEYGRHPNDLAVIQIAKWAAGSIISGLQEMEAKMRDRGMRVEESQFPTALRAALELQQYVNKQPCTITSEEEARIYMRSLEHDLNQLRWLERDLDEGGHEQAPKGQLTG